MIRSASVTGAWHRSPRGRYRGCSSFRRVKTQEGFDAENPRSPPAGGIWACVYPPAASDERRSHAAMNCNGNYSDGRYGKLRNGCPHSEIRSFRQPSALRKRRHPANRKSLRNIRSKAFYGMDIQERSPLPLAAEPSSARDRYGICVRCLPFISVFGNYIPPYTAVPPKPDCRSGSCPKPPSRRFFLGGGSDL